MASELKKFVSADFETTKINDHEERVWLWAIYQPKNKKHTVGFNINDFFQEISRDKYRSHIIFFHNARFDCSFIIHWLLNNDFKPSYEKKLKEKQFTTLETSMGQFYELSVCLQVKNKQRIIIKFRDSNKKIVGTVNNIAKAYNLPIKKGEIDYSKDRPVGYIPTDNEIEYVKNDAYIIGEIINILYSQDMIKMTSSSDSLYKFKRKIGNKTFDSLFPNDYKDDKKMRKSYYGGLTIIKPNCENKIFYDVTVYDIKSSYPKQLVKEKMPWGYPIEFNGKYKKDKFYDLYIQKIEINFQLKDGYIPTLLKKRGRFSETEYWINTNDEIIELTLTCVDIKLILKHYDVNYIRYVGGWKFKSSTKIFKQYIMELYEIKEIEGKGAIYESTKLLLNGLYGKFGTNPERQSRMIVGLDENKLIKYSNKHWKIDKPIFLPIASFTTAYGRKQILTNIQNNYSDFIYADSDSMHLKGKCSKHTVKLGKKIGDFKIENHFYRAKYIRPKAYIATTIERNLFGPFNLYKEHIKCAGMPNNIKKMVNFDNFKIGLKLTGKLIPTQKIGGIRLIETTFEIKEKVKKVYN